MVQQDVECGFPHDNYLYAFSAILLVGLCFITYKLNKSKRLVFSGKNSATDCLVLPVYYTFLRCVCIVLGLTVITLCLLPHLAAAGLFHVVVLGSALAMLREGITVFLAQRSAGLKALRRTIAFAVLYGCSLLIFGAYMWFKQSNDTLFLTIAQRYWLIHDSVVLAVNVLVLVLSLSNRSARTKTLGLYRYILFLLCIFSLFVLSSVLSSAVPLTSSCLLVTTEFLFYCIWPFAAFYALRADSDYWRSLGRSTTFSSRRHSSWMGQFLKLNYSSLSVNLLPPTTTLLDVTQIELSSSDKIGSGANADVYKAYFGEEQVAVKKFFCKELTSELAISYMREIEILSSIRHPNIISMYGVCLSPPNVCLVMEYAPQGSLFHVLAVRMQILPLDMKTRFILDAVKGLAFLHSHQPPIVHGDIKSLNMLIDSEGVLKLADFGESRFVELESESQVSYVMTGTAHWTAPEVFHHQRPTMASDVYSIGMVIWEIWTGSQPFVNVETNEGIISMVIRGIRPELPDDMPQPLAALVADCWLECAADRPTANAIVQAIEEMEFVSSSLQQQRVKDVTRRSVRSSSFQARGSTGSTSLLGDGSASLHSVLKLSSRHGSMSASCTKSVRFSDVNEAV
eukprot:GILJ01009717.1.p1 GENE.GILJ01009717.1~~GILJ01009717.1.p1  ORF type:complete len:625 (-),score=66.37 GILJ01009717.1:106-1980(-)